MGAAGVADPAAGPSPFASSEAGACGALLEGAAAAASSAPPEGLGSLPGGWKDAPAAAEPAPNWKDGVEPAPNENGADEPRPPKAGEVDLVPEPDRPDPGAAEEAPNEKRDGAAADAGGAPKLKGAFVEAAPSAPCAGITAYQAVKTWS